MEPSEPVPIYFEDETEEIAWAQFAAGSLTSLAHSFSQEARKEWMPRVFMDADRLLAEFRKRRRKPAFGEARDEVALLKAASDTLKWAREAKICGAQTAVPDHGELQCCCTRARGHAGPWHVAQGDDATVVARWPVDAPKDSESSE